MNEEINKREIAFHEAGHLVADILFGLNPKKASIVPNGNSFGRVYSKDILKDFDPFPFIGDRRALNRLKIMRKKGYISIYDNPSAIRNYTRRQIISCLSGGIAQKKYSPQSVNPYHALSDHLAIYHYCDIAGYLSRQSVYGIWEYPILKKLLKESQAFISFNWGKVDFIAELLIKKKVLNMQDISELSCRFRVTEIEND